MVALLCLSLAPALVGSQEPRSLEGLAGFGPPCRYEVVEREVSILAGRALDDSARTALETARSILDTYASAKPFPFEELSGFVDSTFAEVRGNQVAEGASILGQERRLSVTMTDNWVLQVEHQRPEPFCSLYSQETCINYDARFQRVLVTPGPARSVVYSMDHVLGPLDAAPGALGLIRALEWERARPDDDRWVARYPSGAVLTLEDGAHGPRSAWLDVGTGLHIIALYDFEAGSSSWPRLRAVARLAVHGERMSAQHRVVDSYDRRVEETDLRLVIPRGTTLQVDEGGAVTRFGADTTTWPSDLARWVVPIELR